MLEICKPLQCKASKAKISELKPPDSVGASVISLAPIFIEIRVRSFCCSFFRIITTLLGCDVV